MGLLTDELDIDIYDLNNWSDYMDMSDYQKLRRAIQQLLSTRLDGHDNFFEIWLDLIDGDIDNCHPNDIMNVYYTIQLDKIFNLIDEQYHKCETVWSPADTDDILLWLFRALSDYEEYVVFNYKYKFKRIVIL